MNIHKTGSMTFWLRHSHLDWQINTNIYNFGPISREGISVSASKRADGGIDFAIDGPHNGHFDITTSADAIEERSPQGIAVVITWERKILRIHLNGRLVRTVTV